MPARRALLFAAAALALSGCSLRKTAVRYSASMAETGLPALYQEHDVQTAKEALIPLIKITETLYQNDKENRAMSAMLAQGYCGYALMFLEDDDPARASDFYNRGVEFTAKNGDVSLRFWNAFCRAGYIQLNLDKPAAIAELPKVDEAADYVLAHDPSFYYNSAYTIKGALLSARPKMLGGDPDKAKAYFDKALAGEGYDFLPNRYVMAKTYAVAVQDEELFEKTLESILDADPAALPQMRLVNEATKLKAKKLLEKKNELF